MNEAGALQTESENEYVRCKICRRKFANEKLPPCEESICPKCCADCFDGGCKEYC